MKRSIHQVLIGAAVIATAALIACSGETPEPQTEAVQTASVELGSESQAAQPAPIAQEATEAPAQAELPQVASDVNEGGCPCGGGGNCDGSCGGGDQCGGDCGGNCDGSCGGGCGRVASEGSTGCPYLDAHRGEVASRSCGDH